MELEVYCEEVADEPASVQVSPAMTVEALAWFLAGVFGVDPLILPELQHRDDELVVDRRAPVGEEFEDGACINLMPSE